MKAILASLFCVVLFAACGKFEDNTLVPAQSSEYKWNLNGSISHDSAYYLVDQIVLAEVLDKSGQKVNAEFDFSNGALPTFGNQAVDKYTREGVYKLSATIKSVTPAVKLVLNVVVGKKPVVVPSSTETVVILISGTSVSNTNTLTLGLNISNLYGYDSASPIYVEASVPGKDWSVYANATETVIINGFKYVKWPVSCPNGAIRVGWYQYKTENGLKVKSWAGTSESVYYNNGLPEFSVFNGTIYKLGTAPTSTTSYTLKINNEAVVSGATLKFNEGASVAFKTVDAQGIAVVANYDFGNGITETTNGRSVTYVAGTYKMTVTVGATVFTVNLEVVKVSAPVYTLKVNDAAIISGATIKFNEGASVAFKVIDSSGNAVVAKYDFGNGITETTNGRSVTYSTAGTYTVTVTVDATVFTVNLEVVKVVTPVYTLQINGVNVVSGATINVSVGATTIFQVVDASGSPISALFDFGNGSSITNSGTSVNYNAGDYVAKVTIPGTVFLVNFHVTSVSVSCILRINGLEVSGDTFYVREGATVLLSVVDKINFKPIKANFYFGDGYGSSRLDVESATFGYLSGTYKLTASVPGLGFEISKTIVVTKTSAIELISSSVSGNINSLTLGLRCDIVFGFNSSKDAEVQGEMPNVNWKSYPLASSEIVTISGIKYFQWKLSCVNGKIRFGWLQGTQWASDPTSTYRQSDGLYVVYVQNGKIYDNPQ